MVGIFRGLIESLPPREFAAWQASSDAERRAQLETLLAVDEAIAAVDQALEARGIADRTALFFTGDNGYMWNEHWVPQKGFPYEESIRVPFLFRLRSSLPLSGGLIDRRPVLNIDLAPTILAMAGVPVPGEMDGLSLGRWRRAFLFDYRDVFPLPSWEGARTTAGFVYARHPDGFEGSTT